MKRLKPKPANTKAEAGPKRGLPPLQLEERGQWKTSLLLPFLQSLIFISPRP